MRVILLALLGMGGVLAAAIFIHYDLPLSVSQLRERFQAPSPTTTPVADMATASPEADRTSPTPSFPVLTLNDQAMNPFIEMPSDPEPVAAEEEESTVENTGVMPIGD
ncbi:MAG: hypothetical protein WD972_03705 [Candidatus Andersenbacteria bacterium]